MKFKKGDTIHVEWTDAAGRSAWAQVNELTPPNIRTVGFYIKQNKDGLYYASGLDGEDWDCVLHLGFIPRGCVRKIRKLR